MSWDDHASTVLPPTTVDKKRPFWVKDDPVLHEGVVVRGGMWAHQREWWNLPNFVRVLVGGYGSGKTLIVCKRMIALALQNAPVPVSVVSPTFAMARQTTVTTIKELLEGKRSIYGRGLWWKYNSTFHFFRIRFRGREGNLTIASGDDPLSLRGPNLAAAAIDEPFIQDKDVFMQMVVRCRHPGASHTELDLTGTPEQLNWGYDLCVGEMKEVQDVGVVTAATRSNLALSRDYIQRLEGVFSEKAAKAYLEGQFISLSDGLVYYGFDPSENIVTLKIPKGAELGAGMDFNVDPMAATVFWRVGNHMHFFDEIELPNADTEYMCSTLKDRYWGLGLRDIYPDASGVARATSAPGGKSDFTYIRNAGFAVNANAGNPARRDRYNAVNGKLKPARGALTLTLSPKCKKLRKYMSTYSHELMNRPSQKAMSHLLDAFSYPIAYLFPVDRAALRVVAVEGH